MALSFKSVVSAGSGWTKVRASDGQIYNVRGTRAWRNNNPGNIEYGAFAKRNGAVGTDGRFAVFPTYEAGRQAKESLVFDAYPSRYGDDLTISQAISKYAPAFENDSAAYAASIAEAIGVPVGTKIKDIPESKRGEFLDAMQRVEGYKAGSIVGQNGKSAPVSKFEMSKGTDAGPTSVEGVQIADANVPTPVDRPEPDYAAVPVPAQKPAEMQTALIADNPASAPFDALLGSSTALSPTPAAASTLSAPMDIPSAPIEPVDRAQPEPMTKTPPSRSMAGVTSDDLASDPLSGALVAEAPTPQSRPALYGNEAGIPTPASRPASDPWSGMRRADDPLAGALAYAEVDPMLTSATQSGFADKLAYAQAQGPSDVNIDPSMMDPAFGAPVDPLASAIKAPVQPLTPPVEVKAPPQVKGAPEAPMREQAPQAMDTPGGLDFFSGQSNYGMDTGGGTLYRDAAGQEYRYNPEFDKTYKAVRSDNGISYVPADPNETLLASVPGLSKVGGLSSRGKKSGEKSNIRNALEGAIKVGAATANPIAAIAAGTLGWNANRIANNGGVLGKLVGGMFGVNTDPYATAERSARNAALANNGGSFQPSSSNPSDYSYSPAAHDAIASGQGGLF